MRGDMMNHTPGPWTTAFMGHSKVHMIYGADGDDVASIYDFTRQRKRKEHLANARLIAAAPELLEALKLAEQHILDGRNTVICPVCNCGPLHAPGCALGIACAAILKAEAG